jgi:outer membrane lipoprotein-sorting protein
MTRPAAVLTALLGSLALGGWALAAAATAQNVPLPSPAPQRGGAMAQQQQQQRPSGPMNLAPGQQAPRPPGDVTPRGGAQNVVAPRPQIQFRPGEATAYDAKQRALVDRVSAYLSGTRVLTGDFVQVGPDGKKSGGEFYMQKPGKIRFDYNPPNPLELIADGSSLVVRDRKLGTQDLYPLSQTPLRFLLSDRVDLLRDTSLVGVYADDVFVTVVIEERQILGGTHRLMLMFGAQDYQLRQWTVTDPQGFDTTVAVYNLDTTKRPDPQLFRIDYTRPIQ